MDYVKIADFLKTEAGKKFMEENSGSGTLKVHASIGNGAMPVADTQIIITKKIDQETVLFFDGLTNSSGIVDNIVLPAPNGNYNTENHQIPNYAMYDMTAVNAKYKLQQVFDIAIFNGIKVIQEIKVEELTGGSNGNS